MRGDPIATSRHEGIKVLRDGPEDTLARRDVIPLRTVEGTKGTIPLQLVEGFIRTDGKRTVESLPFYHSQAY